MPPYASIFMDQVETEFLESQVYKPLVWFRYRDDVFFIWTDGQEKLKVFLEDLNKCYPNIMFTHETNKEDISFLDLKVELLDGKIFTDLFVKSTDRHQFLHHTPSHSEHPRRLIVFSEARIVSRIYSTFVRHIGNMW